MLLLENRATIWRGPDASNLQQQLEGDQIMQPANREVKQEREGKKAHTGRFQEDIRVATADSDSSCGTCLVTAGSPLPDVAAANTTVAYSHAYHRQFGLLRYQYHTCAYNNLYDDYEHRVLYPRHPLLAHTPLLLVMVGGLIMPSPDINPRISYFCFLLLDSWSFVTTGAEKR